MGCVELRASAAARFWTLDFWTSDFRVLAATSGLPIVSVPVLSKITAVIFPAFSNATPSRIKMPRRAAALAPAMIAAGVARPIAHGQATIKTAAAMMKAVRRAGRRMRVPEKLREPVVNVSRPMPAQAPTKAGGERNGDDDRHEHAAHAVAEALDVGAAGLGALHGGDDVRERGGFAGGGHAHDEPAVQIHRAGEQFARRIFLSAGTDSPVSIASSTADSPSTTTPSTGTRSPGLQHDAVADLQFGNRELRFLRVPTCGVRSRI